MPSRHRFLEPIHNVKDGAEAPNRDCSRNWFLHTWKISRGATPLRIAMLDRAPRGLCVAMVEPIGIEPMTSSLQS